MNIDNNKRFLSAIIIFLVFTISIFWLRPLFYILISLVATFMLSEWYDLVKEKKFYILGYLIILIPITSLLLISWIDETGNALFSFFLLIWITDSVAMLSGKLIGGPKLASKISPNKTIAGFIIGTSSACLISGTLGFFIINHSTTPHSFFTFFLLIAYFAQIGDLFISFFKRRANIKDTGNLIPGHGGILDRFDSIIFSAPLFLLAHFIW